MIELIPISSLQPSVYNPRKSDPGRLDLVELSLRKLGWLLPVYADKNGEILSGHQRHLVAERRGATAIPRKLVRDMTLDERKGLNILFNRGTNDMRVSDTPTKLSQKLAETRVLELAAAVPDKPIDHAPCMSARRVDAGSLVKANAGRWLDYAFTLARAMRDRFGVEMPVVARRDGRIINGIGRVQYAATKGEPVDLVEVDDKEAELAEAMLNLLSMDFDIHTRYADVLRYNSFRRSRGLRKRLGMGFLVGITDNGKEFDAGDPRDAKRWVSRYGRTVLDFGAGHLTDTAFIRSMGVDCTPFEPYRVDGEKTNLEDSRRVCREFLAAIADGKQFDTIFLASVLNSVPFEADRQKIVTVVASLCGPRTKVVAVAASTTQTGFRHAAGAEFSNESDCGRSQFTLDYEPNITIGQDREGPKVQRYHTPAQWYDLWKTRFRAVDAKKGSANLVQAICQGPLKISAAELAKAIEFEFDLPYPEGRTLGLVDEAKKAWAQRAKRLR